MGERCRACSIWGPVIDSQVAAAAVAMRPSATCLEEGRWGAKKVSGSEAAPGALKLSAGGECCLLWKQHIKSPGKRSSPNSNPNYCAKLFRMINTRKYSFLPQLSHLRNGLMPTVS